MVEAVRQQRHYKDNICHAEIIALIQAYSQICIINMYITYIIRTVTRPIEINLVEKGQKRGWNAVTAEVNACTLYRRRCGV